MFQALLTIIIIGFSAGFIFSIPVAGPLNVIITSKALSGKPRFCIEAAFGASIIEFFYVLIIVYGISSLYSLYKPFIPYLLIAGAIVLVFVGVKIFKTKLKLEDVDDKGVPTEKIKDKGGMLTGIIINLTNPSLFLGWLISTFIVFSFVSSLGINTGGLNLIINENVNSIRQMSGKEFKKLNNLHLDSLKAENGDEEEPKTLNPLLLGITYGLSVAVGSFIWLSLYSRLIVKYRKKLNIKLVTKIIQGLGFVLFGIGFYLIYQAFKILNVF